MVSLFFLTIVHQPQWRKDCLPLFLFAARKRRGNNAKEGGPLAAYPRFAAPRTNPAVVVLGTSMRSAFLAVLVWAWLVSWNGVSAFTTKQKSDRSSKRPAVFDVKKGGGGVAAAPTVKDGGEAGGVQQSQPHAAAFGMNAGAAAAALAYQYHHQHHPQEYFSDHGNNKNDEDELIIGVGTAVISCILSVALGFGLGYGT